MRRFTRALAALLLALGPLLVTTPSSADSVGGTRFDLVERGHVVEVRLERGHATLVVTRTVENTGPKSDQAMLHLDIPTGAVATRLRTSGVNAKGETIWFEGELLEAEEAARRYKELTGIGGYYPKDPALLSWRSQTHLALQVFPVPARSTKVVEYTLRMPLAYQDGAYTLQLPKLGTEVLPAKVRFTPQQADRVLVNDVEVGASTVVSGAKELEVRLVPRVVTQLDGALASFGYAADRHLVHARIAAAPHLSQVPQNASVVVLLDTSRSMDRVLPAALGAVRAYLSEFPGASVEMMTFDRKVHSPFGGSLPVREALSRLYTLPVTTANGSQVDEALARADAKLVQSASTARRVLLITDLLTRQSLTPERLAAGAVASGAIVHVATITEGTPELERDDESSWAALPRKTGGLLWRAKSESVMESSARAVFGEWVRPKRIEKVVLNGMPAEFASESALTWVTMQWRR